MDCVQETMVPMGDGTALYTLVIGGDRPKPVIFERTPYAQGDAKAEDAVRQMRLSVERGYAVVLQHCRGTGRSEGDFIPFVDERRDGLDTLDWIRCQPFYAGEIYPRGGSYCAWVHQSYLGTRPADVKGAVLFVYDPDNFRILFRNGVFKSGILASWYQKMYKIRGGCRKIWPGNDALRVLPHTRIPQVIFSDPQCPLEEYLRHPDHDDPFWKGLPGFEDGREFLQNLDIPVLFATSYHDIFWDGMYEMWHRELTPEQKAKCTMIVTPYEHNLDWNSEMPRQYPGGGLTDRYGHGVWSLDWLDYVRRGSDPGKYHPGKMAFYTLFGEGWTEAEDIEPGEETTLYLTSSGLAGVRGAGVRSYLYNPYAPASFRGGLSDDFNGAQLQDPPDSRQDILSFLTEPAREKIWLRGTLRADLTVSSSAEDTGFYIRASLEKAGGETIGLTHAIGTLCAGGRDYIPGTKTRITLETSPHSFCLEPGDRLRLDVSSSCFPYFLPHTNRKGNKWEMDSALPAENAVYLGESTLTVHRV